MIYKLFLVICRAQSYFFYFHFQNFYYKKKLTIAQKRAETVNKHSTKIPATENAAGIIYKEKISSLFLKQMRNELMEATTPGEELTSQSGTETSD